MADQITSATATAKTVRITARKARLVIDLIRGKNVAEAMAIQSLPEWFELPQNISLSSKFKMVGNGVPYLLSYGIASELYEWIYAFRHRIGE